MSCPVASPIASVPLRLPSRFFGVRTLQAPTNVCLTIQSPPVRGHVSADVSVRPVRAVCPGEGWGRRGGEAATAPVGYPIATPVVSLSSPCTPHFLPAKDLPNGVAAQHRHGGGVPV
jgi:hypothetical protein